MPQDYVQDLREQLAHELGIVEELKPGVEERGSMEESVDRADEDEQAKSLAEHLVYGWPSKAAEPVGVRNADRLVKAYPLDFSHGCRRSLRPRSSSEGYCG